MSADNRSVATDALHTLGNVIDEFQKRDAIHLAVEPVIASTDMDPGTHVTVKDGFAYPVDQSQGVGIVDPFLAKMIKKGQRFWLILYPRTIQSLRHVWSHPAFTDEPEVATQPPATPAAPDKDAAEAWLRGFCKTSDCPDYEDLIEGLRDGRYDSYDDEYLIIRDSDAHGSIPDEFWDHVGTILGETQTSRPKYFSCSC